MITTLPAHLMPMVEKAAEAGYEVIRKQYTWSVPWNDLHVVHRQRICDEQFAACLGFVNACLDGGVAREAQTITDAKDWVATTVSIKFSDFPALILSLGEAK